MGLATLERAQPISGVDEDETRVDLFRERMLNWQNPVEFVNNMYACHPGNDGDEYFEFVFGGLGD